jgi:2-C-methyl-D-erythritol 2,4-cyclodiphosphate synthase
MALLSEVAQKVARDGWWLENVDVTIAAETPKLAPHIESMSANVVATLSSLREPMGHGISVSVRAKRGEGLGAIGRAEGLAVWAVALLSRG